MRQYVSCFHCWRSCECTERDGCPGFTSASFSGLIRGPMWLMITRSVSYQKRTACVDVIGIIVPAAEAQDSAMLVVSRHSTCCFVAGVVYLCAQLLVCCRSRTALVSNLCRQSSRLVLDRRLYRNHTTLRTCKQLSSVVRWLSHANISPMRIFSPETKHFVVEVVTRE